MWWVYALLSSITAALVAIFGKIGLQGVDSTLATTLRSIIMAVFMVLAALALGKFSGFSFSALGGRAWLFIVLAGIAGALSWLFYFLALQVGLVDKVVVIDRLSLVFVVVMAALFLGESLTWKVALGALLMIGGALLIAFA